MIHKEKRVAGWSKVKTSGHNECRHQPAQHRLHQMNFDWMFEDSSVVVNDHGVSIRYKAHGPERVCQNKIMRPRACHSQRDEVVSVQECELEEEVGEAPLKISQ